MLGTVVIVAYNRPAYLKLCCDYILQADNADQFQYIFALDYGYDNRCLDIIDDFPLTKAILKVSYKIIGDGKQSNNVLNGLHNAAKLGLPVFYIEDDVFIGKDFFTFGIEIIQKEPEILCAILSENHNSKDNPEKNINGYYIKNGNEYQGIGSIFNSDKFLKYIAPHCVPEYVLSTRKYCAEHFPNSSLGLAYSEQDGLIRRIIEANKLQVAFSCVPRCFHAGFFGYHRFFAGHIKKLPIEKQCEEIKRIAFDSDEVRKIVKMENLVNDSMPVDLNTTHTDCVNVRK